MDSPATRFARLVLIAPLMLPAHAGMSAANRPNSSAGSLFSIDPKGNIAAACPLKHTTVKADITGFLSRVTVTQDFLNPFPDKIEAVYTFPLPPKAAVDDMTMLVGTRTVKGTIKRREEARAIFEAARQAGHTASLLDQERPNIFTQAVTNIPPGAGVKITISYVETLKYEEGSYEFRFPMVVGPRYVPGRPVGQQGGGWAPDTDQVPDASRITPQVTPQGTRAGHDISVEVALDAGVAIDGLQCPSHDVAIDRGGPSRASIRLADKATIPNKDFVLKYDVAGKRIDDAVLVHSGRLGGFFTLILQPPERVAVQDVTPKELVFVLDTSGSMSGFPIEKAKETMDLALAGLNPRDTFNFITFAGDTRVLFERPLPATPENVGRARQFLTSRYGSGGTEMIPAIRAALASSGDPNHVRVVCFMTDGYVGNDFEIIGEVQKHPNARVFVFGIGSSVNHFLLDRIAEQGRGEVEYVGLNDDGSAAARRFYERVRNPLLTDISIDWGGLPVKDVHPARIPDLFAAKPVVLSGRYSGAGQGVVRLRGKVSGRDFTRELRVALPAAEPKHDVLATLWARSRVEELMSKDYSGLQSGAMQRDLQEDITQVGLDFRLMTQFTSFVAVEEMTITDGGQPRRIEVPVEMPEGVRYEGVFGDSREGRAAQEIAFAPTAARFRTLSGQSQAMARPASPLYARAVRDLVPANRAPAAKLDPSLLSIVQAGRASASTAFVKNGKAEIRIWLADTSQRTLDLLRAVGFEMLAKAPAGNLVIGRIAVEKLRKLSGLDCVRYIAPQPH
jgi:Ca-activated chloride channel homolog